MRRLPFYLAVPASLGSCLIAIAAPTSITPIAEEAGRDAIVNDVSDDGNVIVGYTQPGSGQPARAFRWSVATGYQPSLTPGNASAAANGCSADGSVVVGRRYSYAYERDGGFVWTASGLSLDVRSGGTFFRSIDCCSADGSILFGAVSTDDSPNWRMGRWKDGVIELLDFEASRRCSADGSMVVGLVPGALNQPAIWREGTGIQPLQLFPGGRYGRAQSCSPDGSTVVGWVNTVEDEIVAFDWTATRGMRRLPILPGVPPEDQTATAADCTADGSTVVGGISASYWLPRGACVWMNGETPRLLYDILEEDHGLDMEALGWVELLEAAAITPNGKIIVGHGNRSDAVGDRNVVGFRVVLGERVNKPPVVVAPAPVSVECIDGVSVVDLEARVYDADGAALTVNWKVNGIIAKTETGVAPGTTVAFSTAYSHGSNHVSIDVSDGIDTASAGTTVTVQDTTAPIVIVASDVRAPVNKGEIFATLTLKNPRVTDACDPNPRIKNNAPRKFPIGETKVRWAVRDRDGNVAAAVQKVTVVNDAPISKAGRNVTKRTRGKMARVRLNGSGSRDANRHALKYRWSAKGTKIDDPTAANTFGKFKIGRTRVRLTVTDEAGSRSTDTLIVNVKKVRKVRRGARAAEEAVRASYAKATSGAAAGREAIATAYVYGALAGDDIDVDGNASDAERLAYLTLRNLQARYAALAGQQAYESYLASGDDDALAASLAAYFVSRYAELDLRTGETTDVVVADVERD